jgi:hypothetical protein
MRIRDDNDARHGGPHTDAKLWLLNSNFFARPLPMQTMRGVLISKMNVLDESA